MKRSSSATVCQLRSRVAIYFSVRMLTYLYRKFSTNKLVTESRVPRRPLLHSPADAVAWRWKGTISVGRRVRTPSSRDATSGLNSSESVTAASRRIYHCSTVNSNKQNNDDIQNNVIVLSRSSDLELHIY